MSAPRFEPRGRLAEGEHSFIERVFDRQLQRAAVRKRLVGKRAEDSDARARVLREARALAQVRSPFVVGVLEVGEDEEGPYLLLEEPQGESLATELERYGTLDEGRVLALGRDLAQALVQVHAAGLVHGQIDASKVFLDPNGQPRLSGFTLARRVSAGPAFDTTVGQCSRTAEGESPYAPEVALGEDPGPKSDLFALCVLLARCLTGETPYPADVTGVNVERSLLERHKMSEALRTVLSRGLDPAPSGRFPNASALVAALEGDAATSRAAPPSAGRIVRRGSSRRARWLAVGAAVAGLAIWLPFRQASSDASESGRRGLKVVGAARSNLQAGYSGARALVVGISRYDDPAWPDLDCAVHDARAFARALVENVSFLEEDVTVLIDEEATRDAIQAHLLRLRHAGADEQVVFYFAGHGEQRSSAVGTTGGEFGYLLPHDADTDGVRFIRHGFLQEAMAQSPAKHFLMLLDCCYSGTALSQARSTPSGRRLEAITREPVRQILTAGSPGQTVWDRLPGSDHSPFTHFLLEGLGGRAALGREFVTASELAAYVRRQMDERGLGYSPASGILFGTGDFAFIRP